MPLLLQDDPLADQEANALDDAAGDAEFETQLAQPLGDVGDLSAGGRAGAVNVHPNPSRNSNGRMATNARASARLAWMWDGTESTVPLAWNPEGTVHDGGRRYLTKKHCHCCGYSGFRYTPKLRACPMCVKSGCQKCRGGADRSKVIPNFYFRYADVPYPKDTSGAVDCFVASCVRRGGNGFKNVEAMLLHARSKHRGEYQARIEARQMAENTELQELRSQVAALTLAAVGRSVPQPELVVAAGTVERPLYVSDKPKKRK
jgi:hypothetical protein